MIKIKNLNEFIKTGMLLFHQSGTKCFYVKLHAGPGVKRYIIRDRLKNLNEEFKDKSEAVRFFNSAE